MKKAYILMLVAILSLTCIVTGCSSNKASGNAWLVDSIAPTASTKGNEGDFYFDTSTYDLYQMTNQDWIKIGNISGKDGINGKDGVNGVDGKDGINGKDGVNGVDGKDGINGKDGVNGVDGKDGINGKDGVNGVDGKDGINGKDGVNGVDGKDGINGKDGVNGVDGKDGINGKDGITPTVTINEFGYWVINGEVTTIKAGNKVICSAVTKKTKTVGNIPSGDYTAGDEYICEVKEGVKYRFFVIGKNEEDPSKVDLIMERNICENGTLATETKKCLYNRVTEEGSNTIVPIIEKLHNATKDWNNISPIDFEYTETVSDEIKRSIISSEGIATITNLYSSNPTKIVGTFEQPLRARLIKYSEASNMGCLVPSTGVDSCPIWMMTYLGTNSEKYSPAESLKNVSGYWTLTSADEANLTWYTIYFSGKFSRAGIEKPTYGIRPVITVSKSNISN